LKTLLIIGLNHPEPDTTAAGCRMMQLISLFKEKGYQITFACTTSPSNRSINLNDIGIAVKSIQLNNKSFDVFVKELDPDIVLFDRFITEEQFGWRVMVQCPDAMRVLDTEDLHFLRKAREEAIRKGKQVEDANLYSETAKREIASMYRCDLSLIISEVELALLKDTFGINKELLYYLPLLVDDLLSEEIESLPYYEERKDFITIGNFLHAPNVDSVTYLKEDLWPLISKELPEARMTIYGAYASDQINMLHDENSGF